MFTGIVDHTGVVTACMNHEKSRTLTIESSFKDLSMGESISVNGVCLTVVEYKKGRFSVDVSLETLKTTNFHELVKDSRVNLERALAVGDRLGGHFVTGHVDSTLSVEKVLAHGDYLEVTLGGIEKKFRRYIHPKGCISLNGVSLTINDVAPDKSEFTVMLIPHTLGRTILNTLKVGTRLNVEYDWMAKMVLDRVEEFVPRLDLEVSARFERSRLFEDI